jgi:hypothetical protein
MKKREGGKWKNLNDVIYGLIWFLIGFLVGISLYPIIMIGDAKE